MYKNRKGKWSFFSKKTADTSPFSSWCGRIPIPFYNGIKQSSLILDKVKTVPSSHCLTFSWISGRVQALHFQSVADACVCVWSVWGKDWRGIRWKKDYFSSPPPQFVIKHNNNDDNINKNDNSPYNVFELNVSWSKYMDKNYLTF